MILVPDTCPAGYYGISCSDKCNCQQCDKATGVCHVIECFTGFFGPNCETDCHCLNGAACDKETGKCEADRTTQLSLCEPGYVSSTGVNLDNCQQGIYYVYYRSTNCYLRIKSSQRFSRAGPRERAREWATLGVHPLSWLLSNNRLEEVCGTLTKGTFSSRLLLSNQDKGCTPSIAHSLPLPLPPGFCSTCQHTIYQIHDVIDNLASLRGKHSTVIRPRCDNILRWRIKLIFIYHVYAKGDCAKCDMHTGAKSYFSSFVFNLHWIRNTFFIH